MKNIISSIIVALALALTGFAQSVHFSAADESVAFRVYNGGTGTLSVVITTNGAGDNLSVTLDGVTTTIDGSGSIDTIAELVASVAAATNASGEALLVVDSSTSLSTDSTDGELLDGTYTATAGQWAEVLWDTSACKFYQVSFSKLPQFNSVGEEIVADVRSAVPFTIDRVYGNVTGTGDVTLSIYVNGSVKYTKTYTSPYYVLGAGNTNVASEVISLDEAPGIPVGSQQSAIIRAARATTATTGNLGVVAKQ